MAQDGQGGPKICPGCNEEVEDDWVKCPVCNAALKGDTPPVPPGPPQAPTPDVEPQVPTTRQAPPEVPAPPPTPQGLLSGGDEARKISENAVAKSKLEAALKENDDKDAKVKELEARLKEKEDHITATEEALAVERMEKASLKKKVEDAEAISTKYTAQGTDRDDLKTRLEETEVKLAQQESERKSLEELVVLREGGLRKQEDDLKLREDAVVAREQKLADDREKVKAQATVLTEIETKVEAKDKAIKDREDAFAKDEAALDQVEASLKERETAVVHGHEQLNIKQGELDGMIDQYAKKLTQIRLREDKVNVTEAKGKELSDKNEKDRTELGQTRVGLETDRADITARSQALYERLQKAEAKAKELDDREKVVKEQERKGQKWQEDLRHTEIHLMSIQDEIDSCVHCSAKDRFAKVDKIIAEAKAIGADVEIPEQEVKGARALLDQGQPDKAVEKASNAIKLAEAAKKQYYSYGVRYTIKTVEKIILSVKELGVSTEEPEGMLKEAKAALALEDYERAEELAKMAERIALYTEEKAEEISAGLRRLDGQIAKAKSEGRDAATAEGLEAQAKDLAKKGNYGNSLEYLREAEKSLLEQQVSSVSEGLKEEPAEVPTPPGPPVVEEKPEPQPVPFEAPVQQPQQQVQQPEPQAWGAGGPIHYPAQQQQYEPQPQAAPPQPQETPAQRFRCPYCGSVFEVRAAYRPVTTSCPYCQHMVIIN